MVLSIILPVYNECNRLTICVDKLSEYLNKNFNSYEIIIVEDCSSDGSYEVAKKIASSNNNVVVLHNSKRLGRGSSLNLAIEASKGEYIIYMDVDLATDISHIKSLVECLEKGASIATGSRLMKESKVSRPLVRNVASKSYNMLVRVLFWSDIHDHQCGFKALNKKDMMNIINLLSDNHWFWDTELLVIAQKMGYHVAELPVTWKHNGGNNLNMSKVKVVKDSIYMGKRLVRLKWRLISNSINVRHDMGLSVPNNKGR